MMFRQNYIWSNLDLTNYDLTITFFEVCYGHPSKNRIAVLEIIQSIKLHSYKSRLLYRGMNFIVTQQNGTQTQKLFFSSLAHMTQKIADNYNIGCNFFLQRWTRTGGIARHPVNVLPAPANGVPAKIRSGFVW